MMNDNKVTTNRPCLRICEIVLLIFFPLTHTHIQLHPDQTRQQETRLDRRIKKKWQRGSPKIHCTSLSGIVKKKILRRLLTFIFFSYNNKQTEKVRE